MIFMFMAHIKGSLTIRYSALKWKCQYGETGCVTLNNIIMCIYTAAGSDHKMQFNGNFTCTLKTSSKSGVMAMLCIRQQHAGNRIIIANYWQ